MLSQMNFRKLSPDEQNPFSGILNKVLQSRANMLQDAYAPENARVALQQALADSMIKKAQAEQAPEREKARTLQAQNLAKKTGFEMENPLLGMTGTAGQIGAYEYLKRLTGGANENPGNGSMADVLMRSINTNIDEKQSRSKLNAKKESGFNFNSLPVDYKNQVIAQAVGMGYSPEEASNRLIKGEELDQLAKEKGFDRGGYPDPIYALTTAGRNQLQNRQTALTEINAVSDKINDAMKPFSQKVAGFSPKQTIEAITNSDPDKQAKFIAARMLQPELAAIRVRMANGQVGITAIHEMMGKALANSKIFESLVRPEIYEKAQQQADQWLNEMAEAANKQANISKRSSNSSSSAISDAYDKAIGKTDNKNMSTKDIIKREGEKFKNETIEMVDEKGNIWDVPQGKAQLFIENGYKRK